MSQLIKFFLFALPAFIIAGIGLFQRNPVLIIPYALMAVSYFGFIEIKTMCSHCPHYAEPDLRALKCWANYGSPKIWRYKPGPMSLLEKIIFFTGLVLIIAYPAVFIWTTNILLLILYSGAILNGLLFLNLFLCTHCMNFACPLNRVKPDIRKRFFAKNPVIGKAWGLRQE